MTKEKPFSLGGQALVEGVMMRSPHFIGAAVRRADGDIEVKVERFDSILTRHRVLRLPLVRGVVALVEMMMVGVRYLNWSGQIALEGGVKPAAEADTETDIAADPPLTSDTVAAASNSPHA